MRILTFAVLAGLLLVGAVSAFSQEEPGMTITKLADHIYKLGYDGGGYEVKSIVSVGDDGILLVDAGERDSAPELKEALRSLMEGTPKYIISTHEHVEHIGGTEAFDDVPVVIGHRNLRTRLRSGTYLFDEFPDATLPDIVFDDSLSLFFNGEEIRIIAAAGGHSDNDIIVWFTESKIVCVGAVFNGHHFPSVDGQSGDVLKYPEVARRVIDMLPDDVTIVPGHGVECSMDEAREFLAMLIGTEKIVRDGLAAGKDLATLQVEDVLNDYKSYEGSYTSANRWIQYLVEALQGGEKLQAPYETIYYALKRGGVSEAEKVYHTLKADSSDVYEMVDMVPVVVGYKLYVNQKYREAVPFLDLAVAEYPECRYAGLCCRLAGESCYNLGEKERAVGFYRKALEINPDDEEAAGRIEQIGKE